MAKYVTDPAELARYNAGLPPDEQAGYFIELEPWEAEAHAKREAQARMEIYYRAAVQAHRRRWEANR